jgi:hypothetical protein
MKRLTISIPTFERPQLLRQLLSSIYCEFENLEESYKELVSIFVSDNSRNNENLYINSEIIQEFQVRKISVTYSVNRYNVGGNMNVLKCLEFPSDGWVWIIGDDDILIQGALKKVLELVNTYSEFSSINFCSTQNFDCPPSKIEEFADYITCHNVSHFLENVYFNNACFLPCNLYNTRYYNQFSDRICESTFTQYPHLIYALLCLDSGYKSLLLNDILVASLPPTWDRAAVDARLFSLYLFPFKNQSTFQAIRKLIIERRPNFRSQLSFLFRKYWLESRQLPSFDYYYISIFTFSNLRRGLLFNLVKFLKKFKF